MVLIEKGLTKAGAFLRTDVRYLARGGFWLGVSRVVSSAASFALALAFGNFLPKEVYGTYSYMLSIAAILTIPTLSGMGTALIRSVAQGNDGDVEQSFKEKLRFGALASLAAFFIGGYYFMRGNADFGLSFFLIALVLPFLEALSLYSSILTGKQRFREAAIYTAITQVALVISLTSTILLTHNIFLIFLAYYVPRIVCRFIFYKASKKFLTNPARTDPTHISLGRHFTALEMLGGLSAQADRILLFQFLGPAALATYSFAMAPVTHIQAMLKSLLTLALPKFSDRNFDDIQRTLPRKLSLFFVALVGITGAYILFAPYFFSLFFPQYIDSVIYSQVVTIVLLFFPQKLISTALTAHAQKRALYVASITSSLLRIGSLIIFIPLFGIWGAIYALFVQYAANALVLWGYFLKKGAS